jgi:hypothetical protein
MAAHIVTTENAAKIYQWLQERGGILVWQSHDLCDPGASVTTPAHGPDGAPTGSPGWKFPEPTRHITDPADVMVSEAEMLEEMDVTVMFQDGLRLVITKGSERRANQRLSKLRAANPGKEVWFTPSGRLDFPSVIFYRENAETPIVEFVARQGQPAG